MYTNKTLDRENGDFSFTNIPQCKRIKTSTVQNDQAKVPGGIIDMDQNRPKTRGLEASEADEDAKAIKAALKEPAKVNLKKIQQKLKTDYGGGGKESDSEDEEKLFYQQPPFDDDDGEGKGVKRKRYGGGRRVTVRKRGKVSESTTGTEEEVRRPPVSSRLAAILKEETRPRIEPYNRSAIEHKNIRYKIGDVVSIQKDDSKYYAQILGFHTDQFCERYASIRWLIPGWNVDDPSSICQPLGLESFRTYADEEEPINMNCCRLVLRPPSWYSQADNPSAILPRMCYIYKNELYFLDTPSNTLTSAERRY